MISLVFHGNSVFRNKFKQALHVGGLMKNDFKLYFYGQDIYIYYKMLKYLLSLPKKESYPIVAGRIAFREFICSN